MGVFFFSLLGIPPLVGFAAKFQIFWALFEAGKLYAPVAPHLSFTMYALLVIGALNTVISLVYYIKVLKVMALDRPVEDLEAGRPVALRVPWGSALYSSLLAAAVLVLGISPNWYPMVEFSQQGVSQFKEAERGSPSLVPPRTRPRPVG